MTNWSVIKHRIYKLDGGQCCYPGCTDAPNEAHHIIYRSQGGKNDDWNLISLCMKHHHQVHNGATIKGKRMSGRRIMLMVLDHWKTNGVNCFYRWGDAHEDLKRRIK